MATPTPLPPLPEDPSITAGYKAQQQYLEQIAAIRGDTNQTDLDRARRLDALWRSTCGTLATLYRDLQDRRRARAEWIEQQMPVGPGITADTSPADRVVLQGAFRQALTEARNGTKDDRLAMLDDAIRFGDDLRQRAALTAVLDAGERDTFDRWAALQDTGIAEMMTEWLNLQSQIEGHGIDNLMVLQALRHPKQPPESFDLRRLEQLDQDAQRQHAAANRPGIGMAR